MSSPHPLKRVLIDLSILVVGITVSLTLEGWQEDRTIRNRLYDDYSAIQLNLNADIEQLESVIAEQEASLNNLKGLIDLFENPEGRGLADTELPWVSSGNTFFGTSTAYDVSVSSGRFNYFGPTSLHSLLGAVYGHHYPRLDLNGELLDELYGFHTDRTKRLALGYSADVSGNNRDSLSYIELGIELVKSERMHSAYVRRAHAALAEMLRAETHLSQALNY